MEKHSRRTPKRYAESPLQVVNGKTITDAIKELKEKLDGLVRDYDIEGARTSLTELARLSNIFPLNFRSVEDEIIRLRDETEKKCSAAQLTTELFRSLCKTCLFMFQDGLQGLPSPSYQFRKINFLGLEKCPLCTLIWRRLNSSGTSSVDSHEIEIRYAFKLHPFALRGTYCINFERTNGDTELSFNFLLLQLEVEDDIHDAVPPLQRLSNKTSSKDSLKTADGWLKNCRKNHPECRKVDEESKRLPKRLIFIDRSFRNPKPRLCESRSLRSKPKYIALSHRWGEHLTMKLLLSNYNIFLESIPLDDMPQSFKDAIQFSGRSGINYIWLDSLCIIQDSKDDWLRESSKMGDVYRYCFYNLSATGFSDGRNGLYASRDPSSIHPVGVLISKNIDPGHEGQGDLPAGKYLIVDYNLWTNGVDDAPLSCRGWVVQEHRLSPRTLHFGTEQLFWECCQQTACEMWPDKFPRQLIALHRKQATLPPKRRVELVKEKQPDDEKMRAFAAKHGLKWPRESGPPVKVEGMWRDFDSNGTWHMPERHWYWNKIVKHYSSSDLTFDSDKLIAVSGLARQLKPIMNSDYHAGLWQDHLTHQLSWSVPKPKPRSKSEGMRGPSWSWAAVDGQISLPYWDSNPISDPWILLADVVSAETTPLKDDEFGHIKSGILRIHGSLGVMKLLGRASQNDEKKSDTQTVNMFWDTTDLAQTYKHVSAPPISFENGFITSPTTVVKKYSRYSKTSTCALGDNSNQANISDETDVFFLPIRIAGKDSDMTDEVTLSGILLLPIDLKGQYKRVGLFEAYDQCPEIWGCRVGILTKFPELKTETKFEVGSGFYEESDGQEQGVISII